MVGQLSTKQQHGHTQAVQLLLASPQLSVNAMAGAARAAAAAGHVELGVVVLEALMARAQDGAAAAAAAARDLTGQQSLADEVLRLWQAAEDRLREQEARRPALQQLLNGICATHRQLQVAAADSNASAARARSAAVQAGHWQQCQ